MKQDAFREMLKEKGLKVTQQRLLVLGIMAGHPGEHLTAEEIYDLAKQSCPEIGLATIYRTVQVLVELHIIDRVSFDDGYARYELGEEKEAKHRHHHAICKSCGKVLSFEDDLLDALEAALYDRIGFTVADHEVKLFGYCKECKNMEVSD